MGEVVERRYCTSCKSTEDLHPNVRRAGKGGVVYVYFMCNTCNTARVKKYRRTVEGSARTYETNVRSNVKYPEKAQARWILAYHVKAGNVRRPNNCSNCSKVCKPDAHHYDYDKPLDVIWLCRQCHSRLHMTAKETNTL